jgi:hypothetical protein
MIDPRLVRLGAAILNTTPLDWDGNVAAIVAAIDEARRRGVHVLCLPELCLTGYGCEDAFHSGATLRTAWKILVEEIATNGSGSATLLLSTSTTKTSTLRLGAGSRSFPVTSIANSEISLDPNKVKSGRGPVRFPMLTGVPLHPAYR